MNYCINIRKLRVKVKSLAQETKYIRLEEKKILKDPMGNWEQHAQLNTHRIYDVRLETRATLLAMGFLKNVPAFVVESSRHPDFVPKFADYNRFKYDRHLCNRIVSMIFKYYLETPWAKKMEFNSPYLDKFNQVHYKMVENMVWNWLKNRNT